MELQILEEKKGRLVFELRGADHTFCNTLKQELWNDKEVTVSAYSIDHPLVGVPKFVLEGPADPKKTLKEASKRLQKVNKDFVAAFDKA